MKFALLIFFAASLWGQSEIPGVVVELPYKTPVADAEVSLSGGLKTTTDINGAFRLQSPDRGTYTGNVRKEGYVQIPKLISDLTSEFVSVSSSNRPITFYVMRTSQLTGTVVDEETGKPRAGLDVLIMTMDYRNGQRRVGFPRAAKTDDQGHFTASDLYPGDALLSIRPSASGSDRFRTEFAGEDIKAIDQEPGAGYWPGGPDLDSATPIRLVPGASIDIGIWKLRKVPLYRVRVSISSANCDPEDTILARPYSVAVSTTVTEGGGTVPCGKDFLLTHYPPGKYWIDLSVNRQPRTASATLPFEVRDSNLDLEVELHPGADLQGRIVAAEGSGFPSVDRVDLSLTPLAGFNEAQSAIPNVKGQFRFVNVAFGLKKFGNWPLGSGFYVKEVRFNGSPVNANIFEWNGAGELEIVVDDKPSVISGSVSDRDKPVSSPDVVLVKWPAYAEDIFQSVRHSAGDGDGKFRFPGLAPGEYRIFALPEDTQDRLNEPHVLERLMQTAEKITVERGGVQSLSLKLSDPSK